MDDEKRLTVQMIDVWALCDALYTKLTMLGDVSFGFKDGYLVAVQNLSNMVYELEKELERARHDEAMITATGQVVFASDDNSSDGT